MPRQHTVHRSNKGFIGRALPSLWLGVALFAASAVADVVIDDDYIVQGDACVGFDCVDGEVFDQGSFKLKANNLRISFRDTTDPGAGPFNSWRLTANSTFRWGASRFSIDDLDALPVPFRGVEGDDVGPEQEGTLFAGVADLDGDDLVDAVFANGTAAPTFYSNNGTDNPFGPEVPVDITEGGDDTRSLAFGVFSVGGRTDVVKGNYGEANRIVLNNGTSDPFDGATIVDITADADDTTSVATTQIAGNFIPDVVVGNDGQTNRLYVSVNNTSPLSGFNGSDIGSDTDDTMAIAAKDVDGDGFIDVVAGNLDQPNRLYLNNQTTTPFTGITSIDITSDADSTRAIALGDVDNDGFVDVVAGNYGQPNRLYLNNQTADPFDGVTGTDIGGPTNTTSMVLADLNDDGFPELMVGNDGTENLVFVSSRAPGDPFAGVVGIPIGDTTDATTGIAAILPTATGVGVELLADFVLVGNLGQVNRSYFNDDTDGGTSPLTIEAGADDDALTVDAEGRVGLGTDMPATDVVLDVAGNGVVRGDLVVANDVRSGVVKRGAFSGGKKATKVRFSRPYDVPYAISITPVARSDDAIFKPTVFKVGANSFKFARNGPQSELVEFHWTTRPIGEN